MKRLCLYSLIASIISGCAATNKAVQPGPAAFKESASTPQDENEEINTLLLEAQANIVQDGTSSKSMAAFNYLLQRVQDRVVGLNAILEPEAATPDTDAGLMASSGFEYDEHGAESPGTQIEIRLVVDNVDEAMEEIRNLGDVIHYEVIRENINDDILCNELQLENTLRMRERLLELLAGAQNVQDVLNVESELRRLNGNIGNLKARLQRSATEACLAGIDTTQVSASRAKPGLLRSILYYTCQGLSWLFVKK